MALPVLEKSYEFSVNQLINTGSAIGDHRGFLLNMKNTLKGFSNAPWTVDGSGVKNTAGAMDSVDRWAGDADLQWSSGGPANGSWIVLGMQAGRQLCIHLHPNVTVFTYRVVQFTLSPGGLFTGGSGTARPTASDEVSIGGYQTMLGNETSAPPNGYRLHLIHSTDGEVTHVVGGRDGYTQFWLADIKLQDPVAGWGHPYVFRWEGGSSPTTDRMTYSRNRAVEIWRGVTSVGGDNFEGAMCCEGWLSNAIGENLTVANDLSGKWHMVPARYASNSGYGHGYHGRIPDMWYGSTALNTGDTLEENPGAPTRLFAQFSHVILPWDGSTPQTT